MLTKKRFIAMIIFIIALSLIFYYLLKGKKEIIVNAVTVTASQVEKKDVTITANAIGTVEPSITVAVKSRVDGQLLKVGFKEGDFVKENQIIFQIDPRPFQVVLQQAEATLARDQAQLVNYKNILNRYSSLQNKGYVSKQDYDQANANVKAQEALVLADQASVAAQQLNLEYTTIRAPISGRTGNSLVNQGNLVKANDANPLVIINQIMPINVVFSVPERQLTFIKQEMSQEPVKVQLHIGHPSHILQGQLKFIDNTVNTATGTIQLKAVYDNQKEELWPGLYVRVTLPIYQIRQALLIPTRAIQVAPEGSFVFVIDNASRVRKKSIKVGPQVGTYNVILKGLNEKSQVVTTGQMQLVEGTKVSVTGRT